MVGLLLALVVVGAGVWWLRWSGTTDGMVDRLKEATTKLYPGQPTPRRVLPRKLLRAAERTVTVGVSGTALVPTRIEIKVHPDDLEPFAEATDWLSRDISEELRKRAIAKGWTVPSGPQIVITADPKRPVRLPQATGYIGALSPQDIRTLERSGPRSARRSTPDPGLRARLDRPDRPEVANPASPGPDDPANPASPTHHQAQPGEPPEATRPAGWSELAGTTEATGATSAAPLLHFRLVAIDDEAGGDLNAILSSPSTSLVLGRSRHADLRVKDQGISGRHCAFHLDPQLSALVVEDLGSTNGTYVAGRRTEQATLSHGDTLRAGGTSWRVELDQVARI